MVRSVTGNDHLSAFSASDSQQFNHVGRFYEHYCTQGNPSPLDKKTLCNVYGVKENCQQAYQVEIHGKTRCFCLPCWKLDVREMEYVDRGTLWGVDFCI